MFCCCLALVRALAVWLPRPQEDQYDLSCSTAGTTAAAAVCLNKPEAVFLSHDQGNSNAADRAVAWLVC